MTDFHSPTDLTYRRGAIADPAAFANHANAASWLYLCGEEFAPMEGGMSSGASAHEVLARAEADDAPFVQAEPLKTWVREGLGELSARS
jgi:hypothetical protein